MNHVQNYQRPKEQHISLYAANSISSFQSSVDEFLHEFGLFGKGELCATHIEIGYCTRKKKHIAEFTVPMIGADEKFMIFLKNECNNYFGKLWQLRDTHEIDFTVNEMDDNGNGITAILNFYVLWTDDYAPDRKKDEYTVEKKTKDGWVVHSEHLYLTEATNAKDELYKARWEESDPDDTYTNERIKDENRAVISITHMEYTS